MVLFQLGRQPEIGVAEIEAVYGRKPHLVERRFASLDINKDTAIANAWRLGSIIKIMTVVNDDFSLDAGSVANLSKKVFAEASGKATVGLSLYGFRDSGKTARQLGEIIRNALGGISSISSIRLLTDKTGALSTATVLHNGLARGNNKKVELSFIKNGDKVIVGATLFIQNIDSYTVRDREKPRRDAHNGMLPPKLAQTIINLAVGASDLPKDTPLNLCDPFCGTGTVLIEAALMRGNDRHAPLFTRLIGSDLNPQMIDNTKVNLEWADKRLLANASERATLFVADATDGKNTPDLSVSPNEWVKGINIIATECYLGRAYITPPTSSELEQNINNCNIIIGKFLRHIGAELPVGAGLCVATPCWQVRDKVYHLPCLENLDGYGYQNKMPIRHLIYRRPEQIVGRELVTLKKI